MFQNISNLIKPFKFNVLHTIKEFVVIKQQLTSLLL